MILPTALAWSAWFAPIPALPASQQDTSALRFLGVRAGAPLQEIAAEVRRRGGTLHCDQSKTDPRVRECRGTLPGAADQRGVTVWVSAIDSAAAMATQGKQKMMQWVRRGRMLRLTWRPEGDGTTASVSLVDGLVLDRWGQERDADSTR